MPTYEYECAACRHRFEEFQAMSDRPLKKCPSCGKRRLMRLIGTGAGIIFKGSGFYETDYKRKSPAGGKEGESGSKGGSESKAESKPETKPESKPKPEPKPEARAKKSDAPKRPSRKDG